MPRLFPLTLGTSRPAVFARTLKDLILADPDLFLYYPLTDATNPGVVADLGPNGLDLTVYDNAGNNSHLWGQAGPTAEIPSMLVLDRHRYNDSITDNQMARASTGNPSRPTGALTISWIGYCESDANYPVSSFYSRSFVFKWGDGFSVNLSDDQGGVYITYGSLSVTLTPTPIYSGTARHFLATFDETLGVAGTWLLYVNGVLVDSSALPYAKTGPAAGAYSLLVGAGRSLATTEPPMTLDWNYWWNGGLCHIFASTRTYTAANALALAQKAKFA
jgi:hypothetical protein